MSIDRAEIRPNTREVQPHQSGLVPSVMRSRLALRIALALLAPAAPEIGSIAYQVLINPDHNIMVDVASAEPLRVDCKNIKLRPTIRNFTDKNGKPGYQEGEDQPGNPIKDAKVQLKISGKDVGKPIITDEKGQAEISVPTQVCNNNGGKDLRTQLDVEVGTGAGKRQALRTVDAPPGIARSFIYWMDESPAPASPVAGTVPSTAGGPDRAVSSTVSSTVPTATKLEADMVQLRKDNDQLKKDKEALIGQIDTEIGSIKKDLEASNAKLPQLEKALDEAKKRSGGLLSFLPSPVREFTEGVGVVAIVTSVLVAGIGGIRRIIRRGTPGTPAVTP